MKTMRPVFMAMAGAIAALLSTACSAPQYAVRTEPVAPAEPVRTAVPVVRVGIGQDDSVTDTWLKEQIDSAPRVEPPARPELPPLDDGSDREGYDDVYWQDRTLYGDYPYRPVSNYYDPYWGHYGRRTWRRSTFPINTALGAGLGAIIGHQRGRRGRGALIGGGVGLLFDLAR